MNEDLIYQAQSLVRRLRLAICEGTAEATSATGTPAFPAVPAR